ncbi:MAG: glutamyl-tRNA reductase [Spirochaetaceae bacterium]|nr:glutamyl-tRNA reductase [Spirochaetaceae bacterium]
MNIRMAGIDCQGADVDTREPFAFTENALFDALSYMAAEYPHLGCVIISTCNRTELWISGKREEDPGPDTLLCGLRNLSPAAYGGRLVCRRGEDAAAHLFSLACGLKSLLRGENQILAQVKGALETARKAKSTDPVLDRLFQLAVTYAKRVKTETGLSRVNPSTASAVVKLIASSRDTMEGLRCMVIGSGVIGRQTAALLVRSGCRVTILSRRHRRDAVIPSGCEAMGFDDRYRLLPECDVIISATASPHHTLTYDEVSRIIDRRDRLFIDLAVPRDMEAELGTLPGVTLLDIDRIRNEGPEGLRSGDRNSDEGAVQRIIAEGIAEMSDWYKFRAYVDGIGEIKAAASRDMLMRLDRFIRDLGIAGETGVKLREGIAESSQKVLGKILFGLKDSLEPRLWEPCLRGIREAALRVRDPEEKAG